MGGVQTDWDVLHSDDDDYDELGFTSNPDGLVDFAVPAGSSSFEEAGAARLLPMDSGVATVDIQYDGETGETHNAIIPPQTLIQILIGEAHSALGREIADSGGEVHTDSRSLVGEALAWVIRNRIDLSDAANNPGLFAADDNLFYSNPPASAYDAIILAEENGQYQFAAVDPNDANHANFVDSASRADLSSNDLRLSYDQAVLSAAQVFADLVGDPTHGAFAFYTPTQAQYTNLLTALFAEVTALPPNIGVSDADFPVFIPIQVVILLDIVSQDDGNDVPSFVFVRERISTDPAVTATP